MLILFLRENIDSLKAKKKSRWASHFLVKSMNGMFDSAGAVPLQ